MAVPDWFKVLLSAAALNFGALRGRGSESGAVVRQLPMNPLGALLRASSTVDRALEN
jgi:hypothetical protein